MPKKKQTIILSLFELERKGKRDLLGYLNRLRKCEESFEKSDLDENPDLIDDSKIYFKQTEKWKKAYQNVESILNKRENIG